MAAETSRRFALKRAISAAGLAWLWSKVGAKAQETWAPFIAEAFRMKRMAVESGDQPYGAVMVLDGQIIGYGPSRVIKDGNADHHAERVALWEAQKLLRRDDLSGATIVSTSRPCAICQRALARAKVARMVHGEDATDSGSPKS